MVAITVPVTGTPKRNLVELAFEECGSAGFEFERTPEEIGSALRKLNAMMYEYPWSLLGYYQPDYGSGVLDDLSGIPNDAIAAVATALAMKIAPSMGATLSPEAMANIQRSRLMLASQYATITTQYMGDDTLAGAGNRWRYLPFINESP